MVDDPEATDARPTLYVCHGDDGGPRLHPCRRVQEALRARGIEYHTVVAAQGNPIPFLRKGSRSELRAATGGAKLPTLKLADGTVIKNSRAILAWIARQPRPGRSATREHRRTARGSPGRSGCGRRRDRP